jgi:hypothetical protein
MTSQRRTALGAWDPFEPISAWAPWGSAASEVMHSFQDGPAKQSRNPKYENQLRPVI